MSKNETLKNYLPSFLIGFLGVFTYSLLNNIEILPFKLFNIDVNNLSSTIKIIYLFGYEILIMFLIGIIFNKKLKRDFADIKVNHKKYYSEYFKFWLIGLAVMFISNCIIMFLFDGGIANNEESIRSMFKINPLYIFFSSIIYAPFVEELIFRQGIKNMIPNKILFILLSGFIFGGIHIFSSMKTLTDLLYIIPYSSLGLAFAYMLYKTDNIFVSMGFHFLHNAILINLQFLVLLFG